MFFKRKYRYFHFFTYKFKVPVTIYDTLRKEIDDITNSVTVSLMLTDSGRLECDTWGKKFILRARTKSLYDSPYLILEFGTQGKKLKSISVEKGNHFAIEFYDKYDPERMFIPINFLKEHIIPRIGD